MFHGKVVKSAFEAKNHAKLRYKVVDLFTIAKYLDDEADVLKERIVIAAPDGRPQHLANMTEHIGYHTYYKKTPMVPFLKMSDRLHIQYLIDYTRRPIWPGKEHNVEFSKRFRRHRFEGWKKNTFAIYSRRPQEHP